jgi:G3E family GTPase
VLRRAKPGRLLIEPSGMGHPGGLFDALSGEHLGKTLELRATIALVDMAVGLGTFRTLFCTPNTVQFDDSQYGPYVTNLTPGVTTCQEPCATEVARRGELFNSEAFRDQVACADVVVGARADTASEAEVAAFFVWAGELYPAKSHVTTIAHGELSLDILDIACGPTAPVQQFSAHAAAAAAAAAAGGSGGGGGLGPAPIPTAVMPGKPHRVLGGTAEFKTIGWVFSREDVFVRPRLTALFEALESEPRVVRFKGVIRVGAEWVMPVVDTTGGVKRVKLGPIAYRRDSRLEIIVMASSSAGHDGGGEGGGGEEVESVDGVEEWECAGRAAAAGDWDALEAAIKAAIRPPMAVKC